MQVAHITLQYINQNLKKAMQILNFTYLQTSVISYLGEVRIHFCRAVRSNPCDGLAADSL